MDNFLFTLGSFVLCLTIVVAAHEFGHFIVARMFGVKVIRFSIGFGKTLLRYKGATEYVFALIPLGGYVRWYSAVEDQVPVHKMHLTFESKPLWQRFLIVLSGPMASILLTIIIYTLTPMFGVKGIAPIIDNINPNTPAALAGWQKNDEIIAINNQPTKIWSAVAYQLASNLGEKTIVKMHDGRETTLDLTDVETHSLAMDFFNTLGISITTPQIKPVIGRIMPNSPASDAGIKTGDLILKIAGKPVSSWQDMTVAMQDNANKSISITVRRNDKDLKLIITPEGKLGTDGKLIGIIGVILDDKAIPQDFIRTQYTGPIKSLVSALDRTYIQSTLIVQSVIHLATGKVNSKDLAGPIGIAQGAASSAQGGFGNFFSFIALFSLMLGILNLLPIPPLDGGRLALYSFEIIFRNKISNSVTARFFQVGIIFLVAVSVLAFYNDIQRVVS